MSEATTCRQYRRKPAEESPAFEHPYNDAVPGAVIGIWADDTDSSLVVAPDKLLSLVDAPA